MGLKTFRIELTDGQNGEYTAGQKLRGRLILNFDQPTEANSKYNPMKKKKQLMKMI